MMEPRPVMKFPQGRVLRAMPRLPSRVGTKLMRDDAVPMSSLALLRRMSMVNGRMMASVMVKGRKDRRKPKALR